MALRERLAYPPAKNTELVEYQNERRTVRSWQQLESPKVLLRERPARWRYLLHYGKSR